MSSGADVFVVVPQERAATWLALADAQPMPALWQMPPIPASGPPTGKAIVICCDGTANHPKQMEGEVACPTNVYRLYEALTEDTQFGTSQVTWYDPGVGTGTSTVSRRAGWITRIASKIGDLLPDWIPVLTDRALKALEGATGIWIEENIAQGYREIVRNYEPGDRIYIFGFSRGAYTARCIAGVIQRCGLLLPENIRFTSDAVTLYRRRRKDAQAPLLRRELIHDPQRLRIHVLGLWDTVASLGLPLWGWWFRLGAFWRNMDLDTNPAAICEHVYHAMSMDEQRSQFFPTVTTPDPDIPLVDQTVAQIWFRGAHADIGGGYANRSLGDIGLEWMLLIARHHGLKLRHDIPAIQFLPSPLDLPYCPKADPMGKIHDEIKARPSWIFFGSWPRWSPVPRPNWSDVFQEDCIERYGMPHPMVYRRVLQATDLWRRRQQNGSVPVVDAALARDGLIFLEIGQKIALRISARAVWNRTGLVFESAALYRITYCGGRWADGEKQSSSPAGLRSGGFRLLRHVAGHGRRLPGANWMQLIGHVAHPRIWDVREYGFRMLLKLLFLRDPAPLRRSLLPLGRRLGKPGDHTYVLNLAHNGLFYLFANDAWAAYADNSGGLDLEIERVDRIPPDADFLTVTPRGEVVRRELVPADLQEIVERRSAAIRAAGLQPTWPDLTVPQIRPRPEIAPLDDELAIAADGTAKLSGDLTGGEPGPAMSADERRQTIISSEGMTSLEPMTGAAGQAQADLAAVDAGLAVDAGVAIETGRAADAIAFADALDPGRATGIADGYEAPIDIADLDCQLAARLEILAAEGEGGQRRFGAARLWRRGARSPWCAGWSRDET